MPHKGRNIYCQYDILAMAEAVNAVNNGMSVRQAAEKFNIPKSTLGDRISGKKGVDVSLGRKPVINIEIEDKMASMAMDLAKQGFGISRRQFIARAATLCKDMDITTPFKDGIPGKDWWGGFRKRHPELVLRKAEKLSTIRSRMLNPTVVGSYMLDLKPFVSTLPPTSVWNMDETGINLEHQPSRVIARQGSKSVPGRVGNTRENITLVPCINAAGDKLPPFIIVKGKTPRSLRSYNTHEGPINATWHYQQKAWMDDRLGVQWFRDVFLTNCGSSRPQLLIMDSHHSHETLSILEEASKNDINIMAMPPHTTHYLCPLDRCVFGPLMREYNRVCTEHMSASPSNTINKESVPKLIKAAYDKAFSRSNIVSGFESTGIYAWNPLSISRDAFMPSSAFDKKQIDIHNEHPLQWVVDKTFPNTVSVPPSASFVPSSASVSSPASRMPPSAPCVPPSSSFVPSSARTIISHSETVALPTPSNTEAVIGTCTVNFENDSMNAEIIPLFPPSFLSENESNSYLSASDENIVLAEIPLPLNNSFETANNSSPAEFSWSSAWNEELNSLFQLTPAKSTPSVQNNRRLTSHRLLTSPEIINKKRKEQKEKEEKENSKKKKN
ncbi:hypothetical protein SNE40_018286 [Patella caerulea]|uniref:HTH psq-type domain-containing protein n=1 Tax=Patella caerulea TaxID=87958 RepID=A0AAN8J814_PATCE